MPHFSTKEISMSSVNELPTVLAEEYNPSEAVTLADLASAFKVTTLTANKRLVVAGVGPVAKLQTGRAGRPPVLFPRDTADVALTKRRTAGGTRSENDAVAQAAAIALAE